MWSRYVRCFYWPVWWWSAYSAGAFTTMRTRLGWPSASRRAPHWRTPLLTEHVRRLKLDPTASAKKRGPLLQRASTN